MGLGRTLSAPLSSAEAAVAADAPLTDSSFKVGSAPEVSRLQTLESIQQVSRRRAASLELMGTVETAEATTEFRLNVDYYQKLKALPQGSEKTVHYTNAYGLNKRAQSAVKLLDAVNETNSTSPLTLASHDTLSNEPGLNASNSFKAEDSKAVPREARQTHDKPSLVANPIADFRECRGLLQEIEHCRFVPLAKHSLDRILEGVRADSNTGKLNHLSLALVKALIKSQAENIPQVRSSNDQHNMIEQLRTVALASLKAIETTRATTPLSFETMSLMVTLLNNLQALDQRAPDVVIHQLFEVTQQLGEKILDFLPKPNDPVYQSQIFDALSLSAHVLPHTVQAQLHQLAVGDEANSRQIGHNGQALLLSSLIRNERGPIINAKLELRASFIALLDEAIDHLEQGRDTNNADLLSTLDSTFLQLTPREAHTSQPASFTDVKTRFLQVRTQALQQLSPFASASVHGRLLTMGRNLPDSDMFRALSEHFEPTQLV